MKRKHYLHSLWPHIRLGLFFFVFFWISLNPTSFTGTSHKKSILRKLDIDKISIMKQKNKGWSSLEPPSSRLAPPRLEKTIVDRQGPLLKIKFALSFNTKIDCATEIVSEEYNIDDSAKVRFKFKIDKSNYFLRPSVLAKKHELAKTSPVKLIVTCTAANYTEEWICTDDKYWNEMGEISHDSNCRHVNIYHLEIDINASKKELMYSKLYDDTESIDFHLCTAEGSVAVHKACLAAHSDVFKSMFNGAWKENANNRIEVAGVTLQTLQHLKDYLYLGFLPEGALQPLLLLANYYFIENLEAECITKLVQMVTPENFYSLLEFAFDNRISELTFAILRKTPKFKDVVQGAHQIMRKTRAVKPDREYEN